MSAQVRHHGNPLPSPTPLSLPLLKEMEKEEGEGEGNGIHLRTQVRTLTLAIWSYLNRTRGFTKCLRKTIVCVGDMCVPRILIRLSPAS